MTRPDSDHQQTIREAFTRQVETYSASERVADPEGRRAFVEFVDPPREASVLDIATGPGFMAFAFAERVRDVIGVDITPAMLARAEAERTRRGLTNVRFQEGDVEALPFADNSFDIVTCGSAFHHFLHPERILTEMVRVLRRGGTVAISDITTSEDPLKAERHNRIEHLRDPSHTRSLSVTELVTLGERCGLRSPRTRTWQRERWLQEWAGISRIPPETVEDVRRLLVEAREGDSAGLGVWLVGDEPHFWHTCVSYVATKPLTLLVNAR
jgi:ubiquinone/menaquinone biosynthesis C-methylase UbiE